jgi:pimeloyl-ACP methyl ester carboxylesterase
VARADPTLHYLELSGAARRGAAGYYALQPIQTPTVSARRAVLVVHGMERDGDRYWRALHRAARRAGPQALAESLLLAPQFPTRRDIRLTADGGKALVWSKRGWKTGDPSRSEPGVSAFAVLDALLACLADRIAFPALEKVILVGHSAGAQLVHRYAAGGCGEDVLRARGIAVRSIVVNPSSYLYLDETRPAADGSGGFSVPISALHAECPDYNHYKYGLEMLNPYLASVGPELIRRQYGDRHVVYLLGAEDNDPHDRSLDVSCAARLQGGTRVERGRAYVEHLARIYGDAIRERHVLEVVPKLGHQGPRILRSRTGLRWLFDVAGPKHKATPAF